MRNCLLVLLFSPICVVSQQFIFPTTNNWNYLKEGERCTFKLSTTENIQPVYTVEGGAELGIVLDSLGNFSWIPSFDLVSRLEKQKEITILFQADWKDENKIRKPISFYVHHQNRPPVIEELPTCYVKQSSLNQYQILADYMNDPDGDPIVIKAMASQLPEGANLTSQGLFTWTPSRNQFNNLKKNPLMLEFMVQDQPEKAETIGKIRIAPTQLDLPPEILLVPSDSIFTIKEAERINFKIYLSDPNGDDNILSTGFICSDPRVPTSSLVENTSVQSEFTWVPNYTFVAEVNKEKTIELIFFALDKSTNRVQRRVKVKVLDTENLDEKDKLHYVKYINTLSRAKNLIIELEKNYEVLTKAYKQAKKGKKNRSILNAALGATTGLAPIAISDPTGYKTVSAIGGTTVLTLGTLEATEVIGKSRSEIMEKLKINAEIRNQLQTEGDSFARKYSLKSARRDKSFDSDRDKLQPLINNQKLVSLELDASKMVNIKYSYIELKKTFADVSEE